MNSNATATTAGKIENNGSATNIACTQKRWCEKGYNKPVPYALKQSSDKCVNSSTAKNHNQVEKVMLCGRRHLSASQANSGVTSNTNNKEWVIPRWAIKSRVGDSQKEATKSISGRLCATAPSNKARLPAFFPINTSPIQAPNTICVTESMVAS